MTALSFRFSGCWLSRSRVSKWPQRWHRKYDRARRNPTVPPLAQTSSSDCSAGMAVDWQDGPSKWIT